MSVSSLEIRLRELTAIGVALTAERDLNRLLNLILAKARRLTLADAGSLFLIEEDEDGERFLRFALAQNDTVPLPDMESYGLPLDETSIVGYVAKTGRSVRLSNAYDIPFYYPFRLNPDVDIRLGYQTRSVLAVPMQTHEGAVIGVLQLINRKRSATPVRDIQDLDAVVIPFTYEDEELVRAMASQAAIAIENNRLLLSVQNLLESFIQAAVLAVEQRDPATKGHSVRVAELTVALAQAVHATDTGPYATVLFTEAQLRELRYAALLHDFGKIGVREHVLVKAEKLYPYEMQRIRDRFTQARYAFRVQALQKKLDFLLHHGVGHHREVFQAIDRWLEQKGKVGRRARPNLPGRESLAMHTEPAPLEIPPVRKRHGTASPSELSESQHRHPRV